MKKLNDAFTAFHLMGSEQRKDTCKDKIKKKADYLNFLITFFKKLAG